MEKQIDIHIFDMKDELFQRLFPKNQDYIDDKNIGKIKNGKATFGIGKKDEDLNLIVPAIIELFRNKYNIIWNAFNYPKLLDNNYRAILKSFYKTLNIDENRNNIVIKFSNSYFKDFSTTINKIKKNKPFLLCVLKNDEISEDEFKFFKSPEYISYIRYNNDYNYINNIDIYVRKISSYIIEKQKYFFELDSTFQFLFEPKCFVECNILLIGESRAGKSSFINRVFNKLVSHEDADLESVTSNSTQYTFKKGKIGIKFIDTPGIINNSNIKFIQKIVDTYFGKIHLIYFFIKAQSNLENCIGILKYIKFKNEKIFKEGMQKIPIIFIKNGEDLKSNKETPPFFKYMKGELQKYKLLELIDYKYDKKEENKLEEQSDDDFFNEYEEIDNNYDNYCEGNIIQIHIPTGKNINKIFWLSKSYLIENNKFLVDGEDNELIQMKEYTKNLIQLYIKEKLEKKEINNLEKEEKREFLKITDIYIKMKKLECPLLNDLEILNIKEGSNLKIGMGVPAIIISLPIFFASFFLPTAVALAWSKYCEFFFCDQCILPLSIQYGFDDEDLIQYDLKKYIIKKKDVKNVEDIKITTKYCDDFFKKLLFYIGPIQCLIKAKELSKNLFDLFEELENRKENDWITYRIHEI